MELEIGSTVSSRFKVIGPNFGSSRDRVQSVGCGDDGFRTKVHGSI